MRSLTILVLFTIALFFSACGGDEPESRQNDTREHLTSSLNFQFDYPKWTPEIVKCGETFENSNIKFTYRIATEEEAPRFQRCVDQSIDKEYYSAFEISGGSAFVIDVSHYKGISSISILGYRDYCDGIAGRIYAIGLDGKIIDIAEPVVDHYATEDIIFENNLENIKEVRIVSLCEMVRLSSIFIRGSRE